MTLKTGDLVVVVTVNGIESQRHFIGRFLTLVRRCEKRRTVWIVEGNLDNFNSIVESCVKKIENPGDDAVDETLLWLPVPSKEKYESFDRV